MHTKLEQLGQNRSLFSMNTVLGTLNIIQRLAANNPVVAIISVLLIKMRLVIQDSKLLKHVIGFFFYWEMYPTFKQIDLANVDD